MRRPKVAVENSEAVYEYYQNRTANRAFSNVAFRVFAAMFRSEVSWNEGTKEEVDAAIKRGGQIILAANHTSNYDPPIIAALPIQEPVLRPLIGNCFIPAKPAIFQKRILREAVDALGSVPVFRIKDDVSDEDRIRALQGWDETARYKLEMGEYMGLFINGERDKSDPSRLSGTKRGLGRIVCSLPNDITTVCMAINISDSVRRPRIHLGETITQPLGNYVDFTEELHEKVQAALNVTHQR